MKYLFLLMALLLTITANAQITGTASYRYYYNSDIVFYQTTKSLFGDYEKQTIVDQTANTLIGGEINIPFNVFDEVSPLFSNRFSLDAAAYYQANHKVNRWVQHYYNFSLNFKPILNEAIYITTSTNIVSAINNPGTTVIHGHNYKVGLNYNVTNQEFPNLVNFYASVDYLVFSEFNTLHPYGNNFVSTHDIDNVIGIVVNIKDFFYFEQNIHTITESNFPSLTFSPYYSDYKTKFWISYKMFNLVYEHVCFHPIESDNPNPRISGVLNYVGLEFDF